LALSKRKHAGKPAFGSTEVFAGYKRDSFQAAHLIDVPNPSLACLPELFRP
jgi:hypothetical protein